MPAGGWAVKVMSLPQRCMWAWANRPTPMAPGVTLERIELHGDSAVNCDGVVLYHLDNGNSDAAVVVRDCVFRGIRIGITVMGAAPDYKTPTPCKRIMLSNNAFIGPVLGIILRQHTQQVQVVGNRFTASPL